MVKVTLTFGGSEQYPEGDLPALAQNIYDLLAEARTATLLKHQDVLAQVLQGRMKPELAAHFTASYAEDLRVINAMLTSMQVQVEVQ